MQIPFNLFHVDSTARNGESREVFSALQTSGERIGKVTPVKGRWNGDLFVYDLPKAFIVGSDPTVNALTLRALLECLIAIDLAFIRNHAASPLYDAGVVYGRTTEWDAIPMLYHRRYGDCKSLTAALVAQYRASGIDAEPVFRFRTHSTGRTDYHILVQTANGFEDPSKVLGMGQDENAWFRQ